MNLYQTSYQPKDFKKELSNVELYGIEAIVNEMYQDETFFFNAEHLGLAYTSSSSYAMYNICNGEFEHEEGIILSYFAITEDGRLWAVGYDEDENEVFYVIEN